ncbi:FHA domain-containing protein [Curtobacterium sp. MCBD17_028]|uniref:FHA domain-containing protein n=1 Tax=Curtobacterium sp. MCBD17_028 TaxID=2175670 RepID=UPI000DA725A1|nr:FHA domain-containing protein [Curtobacterium sp. MCBD17_028]PZE28040.1 hypothetical protein DEI86_05490 [Curtobacterium sp. MCBD17_028]
MRLRFRRRRRPVTVVPERVAPDDVTRMAADGRLARVVTTPPPAPRASAGRVRDLLAVLPERPLGHTAATDATAPARPAAAVVLVLDDDRRVLVRGPGVLGRDPSLHAAGIDDDTAHRITLDDPDRLLSRTHLAFGFGAEGSFWVLDADSANGAELHRPGFPSTMLSRGQRTTIRPDDVVVFGGHVLRTEPATALVPETPLD